MASEEKTLVQMLTDDYKSRQTDAGMLEALKIMIPCHAFVAEADDAPLVLRDLSASTAKLMEHALRRLTELLEEKQDPVDRLAEQVRAAHYEG